jgi:septum formation inhibitor MinC
MSWKPIPKEAPAQKNAKKTHVSPRFQKHSIYKNKKSAPIKLSYRLFQSVSRRLLEFIKKEGRYSLNELSYLITDMQRTIATLQNKRLKLWEKEKSKLLKKEKKKKRKKTKTKFYIKKIA